MVMEAEAEAEVTEATEAEAEATEATEAEAVTEVMEVTEVMGIMTHQILMTMTMKIPPSSAPKPVAALDASA